MPTRKKDDSGVSIENLSEHPLLLNKWPECGLIEVFIGFKPYMGLLMQIVNNNARAKYKKI